VIATRLDAAEAGPLARIPDARPFLAPLLRRWRSLALALFATVAVYLLGVGTAVWWQGTRDDRRAAEAILVLGAAQWNGEPSPILRARLDHAAQLYREGYAPRLVVTGGVGEGDQFSEAAVAAAYLREQGISSQAILVEDHGRSSFESMRGAAAVLAAEGLSRVLLVSDPPHMLRILRMADAVGLEAYGSPAASSPAVASTGAKVRFLAREVILYHGYQVLGATH
jgi:uncharacterized SAM-binding protein YcdF (DUF218 family)